MYGAAAWPGNARLFHARRDSGHSCDAGVPSAYRRRLRVLACCPKRMRTAAVVSALLLCFSLPFAPFVARFALLRITAFGRTLRERAPGACDARLHSSQQRRLQCTACVRTKPGNQCGAADAHRRKAARKACAAAAPAALAHTPPLRAAVRGAARRGARQPLLTPRGSSLRQALLGRSKK
jgi:hypothetical protein